MKSIAYTLFTFVQSFRSLAVWAILGWICLSPTLAQQRVCGTMDHLHHQLDANPNLRYRMQAIERQTEEGIKGAAHRMDRDIVIPVVVHVVYSTTEQNISERQIMSQLQVLNQDFRRQNPDRDQTLAAWASVAADTRISFKLANRDPNGNPTTGITRTRTSVEEFFVQSNGVKYSARGGVDAWPTDQYLNIWVCNLGMGVLGYSQFPGGPALTDGVVIGYKFFGNTGIVRPPFNGGRTCTHEVGHWLNLRHIWGDGPCSVDDHVADTPAADRPTQGCPGSRTACNGPVMTSNFMDYTDDACMNMFTFGQSDRMQALFLPGGSRASLRNSPGLVPEQTQAPIATNLEVEVLSPSSARLVWGAVSGAESYNVRFKRTESTQWFRRNFDRTEVSTSGLQPCTDYEFQMEAVIAGSGTGFSGSKSFQTTGCPSGMGSNTNFAPRNMEAYPSGQAGRMNLSWEAVPGASGYRVQFKVAGSRNVKSVYTTESSTQVQGVEYGKSYFWRVRADFNGESGPFSPVETFFPQENVARLRVASPVVSPAIEIPERHAIRDGALPIRLNLDAPAPFSASIFTDFGDPMVEYPSRVLQHKEWLKLPIQGLRPGRYRVVLTDPDGFEMTYQVELI